MAFGNTPTNFNGVLKEYYEQQKVNTELFRDHVLMGLLQKKEDVDGKYFNFPMVVGAGQGRSASFTVAQTMAGLSGEVTVNFQVPLIGNHEVANISADLIDQAPKADEGAFTAAITQISDDQLENLANDVSISLYRTRDGARGRIASTTTLASSSLVLATPDDIYNFEVGMQLDLAAAQSTGGTRAYGTNSHGLYVMAVNYATATLTVGTLPNTSGTAVNITDAADGIPLAAVGDWIYATGDRNAKMAGLLDWLPPAGVASNDSFYNVNRSINSVRLAGQYIDGTNGQSIMSVLEQGMARVAAVGGRTTHIIMSHPKKAQLSMELGAKTVLVDVPSTQAGVGYTGIKVNGAKGIATALGDLHCPPDKMFLLDIDTWELISQGPMVRVWDEDGQVWLRSSTAAGMEIRFRSYGNLRCTKPVSNAVIGTVAA